MVFHLLDEFEHTLWDLKHILIRVYVYIYILFEHTLWDLKLVALSAGSPFKPFEHTLWDLKLFLSPPLTPIFLSLNIPYGI